MGGGFSVDQVKDQEFIQSFKRRHRLFFGVVPDLTAAGCLRVYDAGWFVGAAGHVFFIFWCVFGTESPRDMNHCS